jgi:putative redox protein
MNMTKIKVFYKGDLSCQLIHEENGAKIQTTAPKDNGGTGDQFSPTDLFAASLASCMLTVMGIAAKKHQIDMKGATAEIEKTMGLNPRRISELNIIIKMPTAIPEDKRKLLEEAAQTCPVHHSIHPDIIVAIKFIYSE